MRKHALVNSPRGREVNNLLADKHASQKKITVLRGVNTVLSLHYRSRDTSFRNDIALDSGEVIGYMMIPMSLTKDNLQLINKGSGNGLASNRQHILPESMVIPITDACVYVCITFHLLNGDT